MATPAGPPWRNWTADEDVAFLAGDGRGSRVGIGLHEWIPRAPVPRLGQRSFAGDPQAQLLARRGYGVLLFDMWLLGHGESEGWFRAGEPEILALEAALHFATEQPPRPGWGPMDSRWAPVSSSIGRRRREAEGDRRGGCTHRPRRGASVRISSVGSHRLPRGSGGHAPGGRGPQLLVPQNRHHTALPAQCSSSPEPRTLVSPKRWRVHSSQVQESRGICGSCRGAGMATPWSGAGRIRAPFDDFFDEAFLPILGPGKTP